MSLLLLLLACAPKPPPTPAPEAPAQLPTPPPADVSPIGDLQVPPLPLWTNPYARTPSEMGVYLAITRVMATEGFGRLQAVETQNTLRDILRRNPVADLPDAYREAVRQVREGELESGLDEQALGAARFIVAFDMDETLIDQRYPKDFAAACHSLRYDGDAWEPGDGERWVQLAPGWEAAFNTVRELGGAIVIFSANVDRRIEGILHEWTWEGKPLLDHPDIAGWLSNSHLILQRKDEDKKPVTEPSKDLRMLDPTLERVILVDDNPTRTFQPSNLRLTRKFDADLWCDPAAHADVKALVGGELQAVADELRDSVTWMTGHGGTFRQAFLPYTQSGRLAVDGLMHSKGWDRAKAAAFVRDHPETVDRAF
ncbi:MAG TPA: NIF family HAD-type phosphatase [Myxococcota bacterium]|nr:NIF family HAD-type phosphatase [Myxococcota bacterium]